MAIACKFVHHVLNWPLATELLNRKGFVEDSKLRGLLLTFSTISSAIYLHPISVSLVDSKFICVLRGALYKCHWTLKL